MDSRADTSRSGFEAEAFHPAQLAVRIAPCPDKLCPHRQDEIPADALPDKVEGILLPPDIGARAGNAIAAPGANLRDGISQPTSSSRSGYRRSVPTPTRLQSLPGLE